MRSTGFKHQFFLSPWNSKSLNIWALTTSSRSPNLEQKGLCPFICLKLYSSLLGE